MLPWDFGGSGAVNILKDTSAPFLLTLLIAAVGWLFDKSIGEFQNIAFLNYETRIEKTADQQRLSIAVRNRSLSHTLRNVVVVVQCPANSECLVPKASATPDNQFFAFFSVPPYQLPVRVDVDVNPGFSQLVLEFLPAGASVLLEYLVTADPAVSFSVPTMTTERIAVYSGFSLRAWLASNYFKALLALLVVLALLAMALLLASIRAGRGGKGDENKPEYPVVVLFDRYPPFSGR